MTSKYHNQTSWVEIGDKRFYTRSKMEANFAHYLEWVKDAEFLSEWEHEPQIFKLNGRQGTISLYKPDFKTIRPDGSIIWYEVKGWMDNRSKAKINAFRRQYPECVLTVIDKNWFKRNAPKLKGLVKGWK